MGAAHTSQNSVSSMEIDRASKKDVFGASIMPTIEELLREKSLRWLGHLIREDDDEPAKQILWRERENNSKWFQLFASKKVSFKKAQSLASNKSLWRKLSSAMCERRPSTTGGYFEEPPRRSNLK